MVYKLINRIERVDVIYDMDSQRHLPEIPLKQLANTPMPVLFPIDGKWKIEHTCSCCGKKTWFGRDETVDSVHQPQFIRFPYLYEKYFSITQLKEFEKLFKKIYIKRLENTGDAWLYSHTYNYNISLLYYRCVNCFKDFLCTYHISYGTMGFDDREGRTINQFQLDEIICVEINDLRELLKVVYDYGFVVNLIGLDTNEE
jgi:hypothetical protein